MSDRRIVFAPHFLQDFKQLQRRYRRVADDLRPLLDQLRHAETPGEQVQGVGYPVYKVRIKNSDAKRGKSGGYRAVYYLETVEQIVMVTITARATRVTSLYRSFAGSSKNTKRKIRQKKLNAIATVPASSMQADRDES